MSLEPSPDDRRALEQRISALEEFDRTYEVSAIADSLAEDVMFLPPDSSPIEGKDAALEYLEREDPDPNPDLEQWPEHIYVSGDLAVVHASVGTFPNGGDEPVEGGHKGLDVYRRDEEGDWKHIISIWNDQI